MINRKNYYMVMRFLQYRREVIQNTEETIHTYWEGLRHFLSWVDDNYFSEVIKLRPTFPEYITKNREDGKEGSLSPKYQSKVLSHAREFLSWASLNEKSMVDINEAFIKTFVVRKSIVNSKLVKREYFTESEILEIARITPGSLREERDIAAVCFLYISAMRVGAFVSMPRKAVDIKRRRIIQSPEIGVRTKNSKAAITYLLPINDEILNPVKSWDEKIKEFIEDNDYWYSSMKYNGRTTEYSFVQRGNTLDREVDRENTFREGLRNLCNHIGTEYKSPHKIRHGFGVYGVKHAKNMGELKAISQNMMHANIGITDGIYGKLAEDDLDNILSNFGK